MLRPCASPRRSRAWYGRRYDAAPCTRASAASLATRPIPGWFDADRIAFMQDGVSISLGARDAGLRPSVTRGLGCRVLPDGEVRVYVDATMSQDLLRDVGDNGQVAVVFSEIVRHRTLQVKAADARVQAPDATDQQAMADYVDRFAAVVVGLGYPEAVPRALLASDPGARAVIACHPHEGFEQTPGPQAGQRLEPAR